ncbi:hypothetical protein BJF92_04060 [Rhizobium rhizosphaerae]|uniref:MAPEG family protein n=1 Tax=Xaviernesmea rhizosphaerae TaxID=1672749 RepID=A0A1Q9AHB4_9HYPH|nr:MAPEG family protein [Xaviernesmea rhizosphaerae]OLP54579.1 hypothetical protein BJF92_04060 [Xaviernesmea rhizosphaerae]
MAASHAIFWPLVAQIFLVFLVYALMNRRRLAAVRAGEASVKDFVVPNVEPAASATVARNLINQFELPVLFYVVVLSLYVTGGAGTLAVLIAWGFVISRYAHAYVHVTANRVLLRRKLFLAGVAMCMLLWLVLVVHLALMP